MAAQRKPAKKATARAKKAPARKQASRARR